MTKTASTIPTADSIIAGAKAAAKKSTRKSAKPAAPKAAKLSPSELATELNVSPAKVRRVLRSLDITAGKGSRHGLTKPQATKVRKALAA